MPLVLMVLFAGVLVVVYAVRNNAQTAHTVNKYIEATGFPKMIGMLVIAANLGEVYKIIEQFSIIHIVGAALLFAISAATTSSLEDKH